MAIARQKTPYAILDERTIYARTGKKRKKAKRKHPRPLCSRCGEFCYVQHIDHGYGAAIDSDKKQRKKAARKTWKKRREFIGYWCHECKVFYYLDGSPEWRR